MKISLDWLRDFVEIDEAPEFIADALTSVGLEVEAIEKYESVRGALAGVVVGKVESVDAHPGADRLRICSVNVGNEKPLSIVCGAPNVAAGQTVAVALVGTTLYPVDGPALTLKRSKIRGVESEGMICAEDELGLGTGHDGILVLDEHWPAGTPAATALNVYTDVVFHIGVTPNRSDALSHYGVARDLAAFLHRKIRKPTEIVEFAGDRPCPVPVKVVDRTRCLRYSGMTIDGVRVGPTPEKYRRRLEAVGQRSINCVVDATNYVMLEIGQPLHAFDRDKIRVGIVVQTPSAETIFKRLDGKTSVVGPEDLVIGDAHEPLCIAGVMGGENSGVTEATENVFLESAYFLPSAIRKTARRTQVHSETSYRFERGTDPAITVFALARVAWLVTQWAGGTVSDPDDQVFTDLTPKNIEFDFERARRLIGDPNITDTDFIDVFSRLEIECRPADKGRIRAVVPRYRTDVTREQDLCEEFVRIWGINRSRVGEVFCIYPAAPNDVYDFRHRLADYLAADGFREIRTNSLIPARKKEADSAAVVNAVSEDHAVLRKSLVYTSLEVLAYNQNRKAVAPKFFEIGKIYRKNQDEYDEETVLGILVAGTSGPQHWKTPPRETDFFTLKRAVERLFALTAVVVKYETFAQEYEWEYGMKCVSADGSVLGRLGALRESALKEHEVRGPVFFAQIGLEKIKPAPYPVFQEIPKFPSVQRDLSLFVGDIAYAEIEKLVRSANPKLIKEVKLFDVYRPQDGGRPSYALSMTMWDEKKTLSDADADKTLQRAIEILEKDGRVEVRKG